MVSPEDRLNILKMVQDGSISADEGLRRMEGQSAQAASVPVPPPSPVVPGSPARPNLSGRYLRVNVSDTRSGNRKVFVRVPLSLVRMGLKMGAHYAEELNDLDIDAIEDWLANGQSGPIVEVQDEDDGEHVEIFIE